MKPAPPDHLGDPVHPVSTLNIANALTVLRLLLVPVFAAALFHDGGHDPTWRWIAWAIFAVASCTDLVDGELARRRGIVTSFGKIADPIADKALMGTALVGLSILGDLPWWVTVVVLVREVGVTLLRFWVIRHGVIPASRGGKVKTLLQAVAIGLYILPLTGWLRTVSAVILAAAVVVTLVTGVDYVARALALRRTGPVAEQAGSLRVRVAVVAVGDELLLGDIVNGNLAWTGRVLAAAGLDVVRGFEVGDDVDAMLDVLRSALAAADAVIVTGGLGPTSDDRTRTALAALAGVPLLPDPELLAELERWYRERGRAKPASVDVQAERPVGARALPNRVGTAPGLALEVGGSWVYAVPGVPAEMQPMLTDEIVPELRRIAGGPPALVTLQLRVAVVGESLVAQRLEPLEDDLPDGVRLAYLASAGEVRVRFTGTRPDALAQARDRAAALLGAAVSGAGDQTLAASVLRALEQRSSTLAVAESLTGGQLLSMLVDVPGASAALLGGVVAYASELKAGLLGVPEDLLARVGAVHADVAVAMAAGVRARTGADWGLATTGVAGPDPQDGHPPGTAFVAVDPGGTVWSLTLRGDRAIVRHLSAVHALELLRRRVLGLPAGQEQPW